VLVCLYRTAFLFIFFFFFCTDLFFSWAAFNDLPFFLSQFDVLMFFFAFLSLFRYLFRSPAHVHYYYYYYHFSYILFLQRVTPRRRSLLFDDFDQRLQIGRMKIYLQILFFSEKRLLWNFSFSPRRWHTGFIYEIIFVLAGKGKIWITYRISNTMYSVTGTAANHRQGKEKCCINTYINSNRDGGFLSII
jgi:hypothetical protein